MNGRSKTNPSAAGVGGHGTVAPIVHERERWSITVPAPTSAESNGVGSAGLWAGALCLCLRRYGAPGGAELTILVCDRDAPFSGSLRIDLAFADTVRGQEWVHAAEGLLREDAARRTPRIATSGPGTINGWRVALVLNSDLPPSDHEIAISCDLVFSVQFLSGVICLSAERRPQRAPDDWPLSQMLTYWERLARGLVDTPQESVGRLPVKDPDAVDSPIQASIGPREEIAHPRFSFELFDDQVARTPELPAVTDGEVTISYHELWMRSNRLAHYLQTLGVGPETIVGVFLGRSINLVVAVIGLQKAGAGYLPIDPAYPEGRLEYLIADSRVGFIVTDALLTKKLPRGDYRAVLIDRESDGILAMDSGKPTHGLRPGSMAFVFYTSGSTGKPKGVVMEHTVRAPFDRSKREPDHLAEGEKVLLKSPVGFTLILREIFWPLHWGGHLVVLPDGLDRDSAHLVRVLRDERVVGANFVPSMLSLLVDEPDFEQCSSLRLIYTVGESLAVEVQRRLLARLPGVRLFVFYGCTEAPAATFRECQADEPYGARIVIGKPMANKKVYLLDRNLMPVPAGVAGEIHTGGQISRGYLNRPALTADRFIPDPFSNRPGARFYRTGDLARQLPDGNLEFLGRADFQVQVRGVRVELGEIEAALGAHPAVKEALVLPDPRHPNETRLVAYYTEREGQRTTVDSLRNLLRRQLPDYMVPSNLTRLEAFPLNANGKVDRHALPAPDTGTTLSDAPIVAPRTAGEVRLVGIWARILGVDRIGVTDRFFDLGGDSILVARTLAQIHREFGTALSLPDFHREPTIEALARLLDGKTVGTGLRLFLPISTQGNRRPIFMANTYPALARYIGPDQPFFGMKNHWLDARFDYRQDVPAIARAFMREMLEIQPTGPYTIFGFSMGGLFALELARQLEEAGQELDCLLLLDPSMPDDRVEEEKATAVPGGPLSPRGTEDAGWLRRHRAGLQGLSLTERFTYVWNRRAGVIQPINRLRAKVRLTLGLLCNAAGRDVPFGLRKLVARHYYNQLRQTYQPRPLRSRAKVFLVDKRVSERVALLHRLFPAGLEVHILATDQHLATMEEPHLSRWMDELKRTLASPSTTSPEQQVPAKTAPPGDLIAEPDRTREQQPCRVVQNREGQFSVWPEDWPLPQGWIATDFRGERASCLDEIARIWTDQRPASLR